MKNKDNEKYGNGEMVQQEREYERYELEGLVQELGFKPLPDSYYDDLHEPDKAKKRLGCYQLVQGNLEVVIHIRRKVFGKREPPEYPLMTMDINERLVLNSYFNKDEGTVENVIRVLCSNGLELSSVLNPFAQ